MYVVFTCITHCPLFPSSSYLHVYTVMSSIMFVVVNDALSVSLSHNTKPPCNIYIAHATFCNIHRQSSMVHPVCMCDLALMLNPGWIQCLSLVCHGWPSCRCRVPCPQDGGPPLWPWWCWIHSPTLGILPGSLVRGGVPCAILWLWRESKGQSWYMLVWLSITWMSASVSNA